MAMRWLGVGYVVVALATVPLSAEAQGERRLVVEGVQSEITNPELLVDGRVPRDQELLLRFTFGVRVPENSVCPLGSGVDVEYSAGGSEDAVQTLLRKSGEHLDLRGSTGGVWLADVELGPVAVVLAVLVPSSAPSNATEIRVSATAFPSEGGTQSGCMLRMGIPASLRLLVVPGDTSATAQAADAAEAVPQGVWVGVGASLVLGTLGSAGAAFALWRR